MISAIPAFVIIPLACAFLIPLVSRKMETLAPVIAAAGSFLLLALSLWSIFWLGGEELIYRAGGWDIPFGIVMFIDELAVLMLLVVNLLGFLSLIYSVGYMRKFTSPAYYYTLYSLLLVGLNGVVISGDMFNLFVFIEITAISSYVLVAFGTEKHELEAAFRYAVLGTVASAAILLGIGMLYSLTSTLNMAHMGRKIAESNAGGPVISFVTVLFVAGFGLKAALVPFHSWLPDAHPSAPAPISAMLSGVVIKTIGVYALVRILFNVFGVTEQAAAVMIWLGIISMVVGVLLAIGQWDFKRLLAYHSISQIGYVMLGLGVGGMLLSRGEISDETAYVAVLSIVGGLFHLFNHALFKSLLFLDAGSVEQATGTRKLDQLGGLSERMPITSGTTLVASLSIAGVPPFCGFWSKLIIIIAAFRAGETIGAVAALLTGVVTLASFLKVMRYAFFRKKDNVPESVREVSPFMTFSMIALALLCFVVGILFMPFIANIVRPAAEVLGSGIEYSTRILGS